MKLGITMLIHNKDDIEFVTEFPCFLGHPVVSNLQSNDEEYFEGQLVCGVLYFSKSYVLGIKFIKNIFMLPVSEI